MECIHTEIKDCFIIKPTVFSDNRGYFFESFNEWLLNQTDNHTTALIPRYIDIILSLISDSDKGIQKSALSNL